jgi:hypothetical protein
LSLSPVSLEIKKLENDSYHNKVDFIFTKNERVVMNKYFSVYIISPKVKKIENELIKSIIHLLEENVNLKIHFIDKETFYKNFLNSQIITETFSINLNTSEIICKTPSTFFIKNLITDLKKMSKGEINPSNSQIEFNNLI